MARSGVPVSLKIIIINVFLGVPFWVPVFIAFCSWTWEAQKEAKSSLQRFKRNGPFVDRGGQIRVWGSGAHLSTPRIQKISLRDRPWAGSELDPDLDDIFYRFLSDQGTQKRCQNQHRMRPFERPTQKGTATNRLEEARKLILPFSSHQLHRTGPPNWIIDIYGPSWGAAAQTLRPGGGCRPPDPPRSWRLRPPETP